MSRIAYVDRLNERYQGLGFPTYRWSVFETSPWTPFTKPLGESCLALISAAGVFREDQEPFDPWAVNDLSFRLLPKNTSLDKLKLHHNYFDHRDAKKDLNCLFPLARLLELEKMGYIGQLAPLSVSLGMGRLYKRTELQKGMVPKMLDNALVTSDTPGELIDLPYEWGESFSWTSFERDVMDMLSEEGQPLQTYPVDIQGSIRNASVSERKTQ